jgi:L-seryl-tRNA(Ser) seleniumtransferase
MNEEKARRPPSMEALLSSEAGTALVARHGRARAKEELRTAAQRFREAPPGDSEASENGGARILADAATALQGRAKPGPRPVINATGVLLHTNLGRAPLADAARAAAWDASGFCTLELDLLTGARGSRGEHVRPLVLSVLAPGRPDLDALVVTNNAAALLLALDTVANGKPVAVSRGELVAIGGDFRVPSIMAKSGASLMEVGTTNKTSLADYEEALLAGASAILKVHPSNYRVIGYTQEVGLAELSALAKRHGVPLLYDAGAGAPAGLASLTDGPLPLGAIDAGADLVCFSGDKTLGGPQAGILIGTHERIADATRNPLARALRPDKLVLAALAATLDLYASGRDEEVPLVRMLRTPLVDLERRAAALAAVARTAGFLAEVVPTTAIVGGGSGAESTLPSIGVSLRHPSRSEDELLGSLRSAPFPIIARIADGCVVLDVRTIGVNEDESVADALRERLS